MNANKQVRLDRLGVWLQGLEFVCQEFGVFCKWLIAIRCLCASPVVPWRRLTDKNKNKNKSGHFYSARFNCLWLNALANNSHFRVLLKHFCDVSVFLLTIPVHVAHVHFYVRDACHYRYHCFLKISEVCVVDLLFLLHCPNTN